MSYFMKNIQNEAYVKTIKAKLAKGKNISQIAEEI